MANLIVYLRAKQIILIMRKIIVILAILFIANNNMSGKKKTECFPNGEIISEWFSDTTRIDINNLGKQYVITDYGVVNDSSLIQTEKIQNVIDQCYKNGGGVVVVPKGTFLTGSLFFKQGTNLYLSDGAKLKGSDAITNYKIIPTRLEGVAMNYFAALINADHLNGFSISGRGTIDGNGKKFYDEFWLRRKVIPNCTNLEALRPRLLYISNSTDVKVCGVRMINSGFWTNHIYKCKRVKYIGCYIYAPTDGYPKGPSTDAIDLDVCKDVLIDGCYVNVNDDGICLKGGKGTFVDKDSTNGICQNIIVQNCSFGKAGGGITFGSECFDAKNIIMRNCRFNKTSNILLFKMRPDTPQKYQYVSVENCTGNTTYGIRTRIWTQFFDLRVRKDMPRSYVSDVEMKDINVTCSQSFYELKQSDKYDLGNFSFENINAKDSNGKMPVSFLKNCKIKNVEINGNKIK